MKLFMCNFLTLVVINICEMNRNTCYVLDVQPVANVFLRRRRVSPSEWSPPICMFVFVARLTSAVGQEHSRGCMSYTTV